ncbi:MAG: Sec-independent protein translocase protein TatB [Acidimicrobiales bacterium]
MFNVGGGELLVILLIALIVLGPDKLPEAARKVGRVTSELRRMSQGFQQEIRQAMDITGSETSGGAGPSLPPVTPVADEAAAGAAPTPSPDPAPPASGEGSHLRPAPDPSSPGAGTGDASAA